MLIIILVLLLLSFSLFYYTQCQNKEGLDDNPTNDLQLSKDPLLLATKNAANIASLSTQIKGFAGVKTQALTTQADVKTLNSQFNNLAPLKKRSLENAADLVSLTKQVTPLVALKQIVANLSVEADTNSKTIIQLGRQIQKLESTTCSVSSPGDLNTTLGT